ncbi:hypothetical protein NPIL_11811 [Nephila pilipes]|uniref:Uncharacterized protein n=1 Tax=Nephila pilipes TaxID=299642 RepID=A0A8X6NLM9_NEPPI|nr:hypothetical protein NPIL_11811 [Nephila pilipes]
MINLTLKTTHMSSLKEQTKEKLWRNDILILSDCSRSNANTAFRLTTGHDSLYAHLCRFRIVDNPACPLCCSGAAMKADHPPPRLFSSHEELYLILIFGG